MDTPTTLSTPQTGGAQIVDAPPPFNKATADVILRSSDLVDFRVRKGIMAEASGFFEQMFTLPQPTPGPVQVIDRDADLPIICMEEDSRTLEPLLRLCYPAARNRPTIEDINELRAIICAATKYDMQEVLIALKQDLQSLAEAMPVRVFAVALLFKFVDVVKEAAKAFLAFAIEDADAPELADIRAKDFNALLKYHRACGVVASRVASDPSWASQYPGVWLNGKYHSTGVTCSRAYIGTHTTICASEWWIKYMAGSTAILAATPSGKAILREGRTDVALRDASACAMCKLKAMEQMRLFTQRFAEEVEKATSQVRPVFEVGQLSCADMFSLPQVSLELDICQ